ncbi:MULTISPECIES: hypothetical protein [unclassified Lentimonas]|uniref:hypothetical protein n=1 Tax=unclassified Lentimonas TaxID=2630993 RepID=UPI001389FFDF|nr:MULTISPECIES: hypothetical protein [unclassified Lentimonas]
MSKRDIQPYWRPDFKIQSTLPDIKVIRTDFIINSVAVALAMLAVFTLLKGEYRAHVLRGSITAMEERIEAAQAADSQSLKESAHFRQSAQSVVELQRFFRAPFIAHELLAELSVLKPDSSAVLSRMTLSESVNKQKDGAKMGYEIAIVGEVEDLAVLTEFKGALQSSPSLNPEGFIVVVDESLGRRDTNTGIIPFKVSISLTAKASTKGGKG